MDKVYKILVVEDDQFLGDLLVDHLNKSGLETALCRDAESALDLLKKDEIPSLMLLDLLLPGMDGFQLLHTLKELGIFPEKLPVIILSNLSQQEKIEEGLKLGVRDFLGKSNYDLDDITKKVKDSLVQING